MAGNILILIVGNANLIRDSLCALLGLNGGFEVLGAIDSDVTAIESATVKAVPDVALVHAPILSIHGHSSISAVRRRWPDVRVLVLTSQFDDFLLGAAAEAGIRGCILDSDNPTELMFAIRSVFSGKRYLTPSLSLEDAGGPDKLSAREKEVMKLIAAGYRTREIAARLALSLKTVEKHRASLMRKLGLRTAGAVAAYAVAHGYMIV